MLQRPAGERLKQRVVLVVVVDVVREYHDVRAAKHPRERCIVLPGRGYDGWSKHCPVFLGLAEEWNPQKPLPKAFFIRGQAGWIPTTYHLLSA